MGMAYERPARRTSHTEALGEFIQDACKGNLASAPCSSFQRPFTPTSSLSSSSSLTSLSSFVSRRSSAVAGEDFETAWPEVVKKRTKKRSFLSRMGGCFRS